MTNEQMRREFEAFTAERYGFEVSGYAFARGCDSDTYASSDRENEWQFWQAATLKERERCAVMCEALSINAGRIRAPEGSLEGDTGYECADAIRMPPTATEPQGGE